MGGRGVPARALGRLPAPPNLDHARQPSHGARVGGEGVQLLQQRVNL